MGQKSAVDKLPEPLRKRLIELLNRPDVTQLEIVDAINEEAGEPLISKSSLNRYAQRMKKFAEKNRQAREVAEAYLEKYGSDTRNKLGKVVNEQRRPDSNRLPSPYASLAPIQGVFLCSSYKKHNAIASKSQSIFLITVKTPHRSFFATV